MSPRAPESSRGTLTELWALSTVGPYAVLTKDTMPQTYKRKRSWSRAVFSNLQRKGLEKRFEIQKYVTKPDRKQLAAMLGLTGAQVSQPGLPPSIKEGQVLDFRRPREFLNLRQQRQRPIPKMYVNRPCVFILANRPKNR